jgi:hypothetical protein
VAAILAAAAALSVVLPRGAWGEVLDFVRVDGDNSDILVLTVIGALVAGSQPAPRSHRPLGWYAPGDAAFVGALLVAIVLGGRSFEASISQGMGTGLTIGVVLWLVMTGVGALFGRRSVAADAGPAAMKTFGIGLFAIASIGFMAVPAITLGIMTMPEAFIFFGLPAALIFRLVVGLIAGRGIAGYGLDLLRGVADGAWIVVVVFAAQMASIAVTMVGAGMPAVALPPVIATVALAAAILLLGILAGPTFGALLAAPLFMPLLKMAGVSPRAAALVLVPALMLSYARPALDLSLLAPAFGGAARRLSNSSSRSVHWFTPPTVRWKIALRLYRGSRLCWMRMRFVAKKT